MPLLLVAPWHLRGCGLAVTLALVACRPAPASEAPAQAAAAPSSPAAASPGAVEPEPEPGPSNSAVAWEPIAEEDGITVTARPSENSRFQVFRGEGVVEASLFEVLAVITDAERHHEWVHACSASGMVAQTSEAEGVIYNRTATPWPVPDRDVVLDSHVEALDGGREVRVRFTAVAHPQRPPEDGVVRMTFLEGHYHLWAEAEAETRVQYQVDSDPGGSLPAWLATRGTREMPLQTLRGLRTQLSTTRGSYATRVEALRRALLGE